jgi:hypothetical protein
MFRSVARRRTIFAIPYAATIWLCFANPSHGLIETKGLLGFVWQEVISFSPD